MIICARATRGLGRPSLDARSGDHSQWLCLLQRKSSTSRRVVLFRRTMQPVVVLGLAVAPCIDRSGRNGVGTFIWRNT